MSFRLRVTCVCILLSLTPLFAQAAPLPIVTERLVIRAIDPTQGSACRDIWLDPQIQAHANSRTSFSDFMLGDTITRTQRALENPGAWIGTHGFLSFTLNDKASGQSLGIIELRQAYPKGYLESSTMILGGPGGENWNQGLGTEARRALLPLVFDTLKAPGLIAVISSTNPASKRVTEKLGFRFTRNVPARSNVIDGSATWQEFRLARETYLGQEALPSAKGVVPETFDSVARTIASEIPDISKIGLVYGILMRDGYTRSQLAPEFISVAAEKIVMEGLELIPALRAQKEQLVASKIPEWVQAFNAGFARAREEIKRTHGLYLHFRPTEMISFSIGGASASDANSFADPRRWSPPAAYGFTQQLEILVYEPHANENTFLALTDVQGPSTGTFLSGEESYQRVMNAFRAWRMRPSRAVRTDVHPPVDTRLQHFVADQIRAMEPTLQSLDPYAVASEIAKKYLRLADPALQDLWLKEDANGPVVFSVSAAPAPTNPTTTQAIYILRDGKEFVAGTVGPSPLSASVDVARSASEVVEIIVPQVQGFVARSSR